MKIKHIIGGILIALGVLAVLGAVGHLDYLDERGEHYGAAEVKDMLIKSVVGFSAAGVGAFLCRDIEVNKSEISANEPRLEEKENRAD